MTAESGRRIVQKMTERLTLPTNALLLAGAGAIALAATPALAQETGTEASAAASEPDAAADTARAEGGLQDIVVTARRASERAQDVPIAITTVTSQDLTRVQTQSAS